MSEDATRPDFYGDQLDRLGHGPDGLTDLQRRWCEEYVCCWKKGEAARNAGYKDSDSRNAGMRNSRHPACMAYVATLLEGRKARVKIDLDYVLFNSVIAVEMAKEQGNVQAMARALEVVGKHVDVKAFLAQGDGGGAGGSFMGDLSRLSRAELVALSAIVAKLGSGPGAPDTGSDSGGAGGAGSGGEA